MVERIEQAEFHARLKAQGVPTREDLAFKCPCCGTVQTIGDLIDAGVAREEAEKYIGFSCVGRFNGAGPATRECKPQPGKYGCNWTLGGLLHIHTLEVIDAEGRAHPMFQICDAAEAQQHATARAAQVMAKAGKASAA